MHKERDMTLPQDNPTLLGRVWNAAEQGPSVVTVRDGRVIDITTKDVMDLSLVPIIPNCPS